MSNTPNDHELWQQEISGISPMNAREKGKVVITPVPKTQALPTQPTQQLHVNIAPINLASLGIGDFRDIDGATIRKLKRGQLAIGAKIDLHGMKQLEAHSALEEFVSEQVRKGKKLVLVVTGKGSLSQPSVLKTTLPRWLNAPTLRPYVIAFDHANQTHGGSGAFYVLLRKKAL